MNNSRDKKYRIITVGVKRIRSSPPATIGTNFLLIFTVFCKKDNQMTIFYALELD